jgi:hypothetical protein
MNGIVCEALYPRLSQDHGGLPIKNVYLDGTGRDLTSELEIFLELARTYHSGKPHARHYPRLFFEQPYVAPLAAGQSLHPDPLSRVGRLANCSDRAEQRQTLLRCGKSS